MAPIVVLGLGSGGVQELSLQIDDEIVAWALLRFQVGSGTFIRTKLVAIHCNGDGTPIVSRGRLNARSGEVLGVLGEAHANLEVKCARELTLPYICERVLPLFAADDMGSYSAPSLREEYDSIMLAQSASSHPSWYPGLGKERVTARDHPGRWVTAGEALRAVGDSEGPYNWALLDPVNLELHNAGGGGLEEMKTWLVDDKVLFGALRLDFAQAVKRTERSTTRSLDSQIMAASEQGGGAGSVSGLGAKAAPTLTKNVFIHWVGPGVRAVKRGQWNAQRQDAEKSVSKLCAITLRWEAHSLDDVNLPEMIKEIRRLTVIDACVADAMGFDQISVEAYLAGLDDKASRGRQRLDSEADCKEEDRGCDLDLVEVVRTVRSPTGEWNWVLLGMRRPSAADMSPEMGGA